MNVSEIVSRVLAEAADNNGYAFGDWVRKSIIHKGKSDSAPHIDLWFKNKGTAENFVLNNQFNLIKNYYKPSYIQVMCNYSFSSHFIIRKRKKSLVMINIFVNTEFPIIDFEANCIVWDPVIKEYRSKCSKSTSDLIQSIVNKTTEILPKYLEYLIFPIHQGVLARQRICDEFFYCKWTVTLDTLPITIVVDNIRYLQPQILKVISERDLWNEPWTISTISTIQSIESDSSN